MGVLLKVSFPNRRGYSASRATSQRRSAASAARLACATALLLSLAACSSVPDSLNPKKWWESVDRLIDPPPDPLDQYGGDQPYPNLATVPGRPASTPAADRQQIANGLVADRGNAAYAQDQVRASPDAAAPLPEPTYVPPSVAPSGVIPGQPAAPFYSGAPAAQQSYLPTQAPPGTAVPRSNPQTANYGEIPLAPPPPPNLNGDYRAAQPYSGGVGAAPSGSQVAVIYFPDGAAVIGEQDRFVLGQVADYYRRHGGRVRVIGHASGGTSGSMQANLANLKISGDRADAVANELVRLGVPSSAVERSAASASDPRADESAPNGAAVNRRAEIFID